MLILPRIADSFFRALTRMHGQGVTSAVRLHTSKEWSQTARPTRLMTTPCEFLGCEFGPNHLTPYPCSYTRVKTCEQRSRSQ